MACSTSIAVAFIFATGLVQASQSSSGGECPSDEQPRDANSLVQMNLQMKVLKDRAVDTTGGAHGGLGKVGACGLATGAHIASDSQAAGRSIKLIVNSDVRYGAALGTLFESMSNTSFHRWNDVIVIRGSASNDSDPFTPDTAYGKRGVTYIDTKLRSFDLHGLSGLLHYHNHPRVKANVYFYIRDAVLVNSTFPEIFGSMASTGDFEARHCRLPFNNLCVFGSGVVDRYGVHLDSPVSKARGGLSIDAGYGNGVNFAETVLETRFTASYKVDLWHLGYPRRAVYYPALGLTKYGLGHVR